MRQCGGQKDDFGSGIAIDLSGRPVITGAYRHKIIFPLLYNFNLSTIDGYASAASVSPYCSDPLYSNYCFLDSFGNADVFIAMAIDSTRMPYDYYKRSGTICNLDYIGCCINQSSGMYWGSDAADCAPDSIDVCDITYLYAVSNTSSASFFSVLWDNYEAYSSPGPIFYYRWSTGDTTRNISVISTGNYSVTITSIDSCFQSSDSVFVNVHQSPSKPSISDDVVINTNSFFPAAITLCDPDIVILTGGNTGNNFFYWTGPGLPTNGLAQLSITVNILGTYHFYAENSFGCKTFTSVSVNFVQFPAILPYIFNEDSLVICAGDQVSFCIYDGSH